MNKSFKVVFSKARSALMVVNEATSSIQAKGTKTVIAVAAAMVAGGAMAATTSNGELISPNMTMTTPSGTTEATHAALQVRPSSTETIVFNNLSYGTKAKVEGVTISYESQPAVGTQEQKPNLFSIIGGTISGFDVKKLSVAADDNAKKGEGGSVFEAKASPDSTHSAVGDNLNILIDGVTFADNHAAARGGVGFISGVADFKIQNSIHTGNKVDADGGVYQIGNHSTGTITGSTFSGNSAKKSGGALRVSNSTVTIDKSVFDGNTTKVAGGAITVDNNSELTVKNSVFTNNVVREGKTGHGGAVYVSGKKPVTTVDASEFTGNKAGHGGAFYIQGQTATFTDTVFTNNEAYEYGGALRVNTGNVTFKVTKGDVAYTGNKAGTAADSVAGQRYNGKTGGFLYLQSAAGASGTATFDVADGATLTIGKDATADSIASYSKTGAVSTITKTGAGDLVVNGDMSAFVGYLTVSSGSMTIAGGIGEYDLAVQEAVNAAKDSGKVSGTSVGTKVAVDAPATLTVGNLNVTDALSVTANGDFTAGNITVTKGTYKDLKVAADEKAGADHSTTGGAATITVADKKTAKVGDITVDAGAFTKSGSGSLTAGNATVNANGLAVSEGTLTVKNFTTGASGSATVGNKGTLEVTGTITGEKQSLDVSGSLATALNNVVDYANGTAKAKTNAVVKFSSGAFVVTDAGMQYTKAQGDSIKTAAGSTNLKIANGTLVAADAKTPLTLADVATVQGYAGAADIVETAKEGTYTNDALTTPTTIGKLTVNAKGANTKLTSVTLNGTDVNKFTLRGNAKGEVLAVPSDVKTIDISHVRFGEKAADHGVVTNALKVTTDAGVDAGSFDFKGDVELNGAFSIAKNATARFLGDVKDAATTSAVLTKGINNEGTTVVGTVPAADATDKTLQVNASTQTLNGGLTVFGAKHEAAALQYKAAAADNNVICVGEQTTLNKSQQFGTTATNGENVVAIDLASVAANGYTAKSEDVRFFVSRR